MKLNQVDFIFWGASGQAKVLAEIVQINGGNVLALFDAEPIENSPLAAVPVLQGRQAYLKWMSEYKGPNKLAAIAAIGGDRGLARLEYMNLFKSSGCLTPSLIHPSAFVAESAVIGENCQILAMAAVAVSTEIGECSIINTRASVDHECVLGHGVHIAPGAILCGCVSVGANTLIGAGAIVLPRIKIGSHVIVGAGAVVTKDVPDNVVVHGNPARIIRENKND